MMMKFKRYVSFFHIFFSLDGGREGEREEGDMYVGIVG